MVDEWYVNMKYNDDYIQKNISLEFIGDEIKGNNDTLPSTVTNKIIITFYFYNQHHTSAKKEQDKHFSRYVR